MNILKQIYPAFAMTVVLTVLLGIIYPLVCNRARAGDLSATGGRQPDRERRKGHRIELDRPAVHRAGLFSFAAFGCRQRVRRNGFERHESRARPSQKLIETTSRRPPNHCGKRIPARRYRLIW